MPGLKRCHFIGLGEKLVNKCRPAAGVADDENRILDLNPSKLRKQDMIQQQKKGCQHGPDHKKQDDKTKKHKMPIEFE
jgi:hypothetical protein